MHPLNAPIRSLLVLGPARSGKSRYAQRLAEGSGLNPILIATAEAKDNEMAARIARHAAERAPSWSVIEEPLALADALNREARNDRILVVDCITLWLSNVLLRGQDLSPASQHLAQSIAGLAGPAIFVSNEVGSGIVPDNPLARAFRDAQGLLNQALGRACDAVVLVSAGIPIQIKPAPEPGFRF
jgi:adenosylcobinamide kinase/adenosylcobinamide-phosphate guanylyltransferase